MCNNVKTIYNYVSIDFHYLNDATEAYFASDFFHWRYPITDITV